MTNMLLAVVEVSSCSAELFLNDIPIIHIGLDESRFPLEAMAIEHALVPGENRLELWVDPTPVPRTSAITTRKLVMQPAQAEGRIIRLDVGDTPMRGHGEPIATVSFDLPEPTDLELPRRYATAFTLERSRPRLAFQDGAMLTLDSALRDEVDTVLDDLEACLARGDLDRLLELHSVAHADVSKAYPAWTREAIRADFAARIARHQEAEEPVIRRDRENARLRLFGDGRVVACFDAEGRAAVKTRSARDGSGNDYPVFLSRIDGRLRIIR